MKPKSLYNIKPKNLEHIQYHNKKNKTIFTHKAEPPRLRKFEFFLFILASIQGLCFSLFEIGSIIWQNEGLRLFVGNQSNAITSRSRVLRIWFTRSLTSSALWAPKPMNGRQEGPCTTRFKLISSDLLASTPKSTLIVDYQRRL
jgi:hypothetical protein